MSIFRNVLDLQNELIHKHLAVSFLNTFLWLLPKIEQKRVSSCDKIVWCKNSRVAKDLSNKWQIFLFSVPQDFVILSTRKFHVFLKNIPHKKSIKLESLLCKFKNWSSYHFSQPLRKESKMPGPSNVYFRVLHENPFTFPFECVQRCMMAFRMDAVKLHRDAFKSMSDVHKIYWQHLGLPLALFHLLDFTLHKKWSFSLRISSVNVTKFAVSCGFGHVYWRNP